MEIPGIKGRITIERQRSGKPALVKYVLEAPYDREKGYARPRTTTIGHRCGETVMHPTSQYARIFPSLWEAATGERVGPSALKIGLFSACQAVNAGIGIKDVLDEAFGVDFANALMDYVMYALIRPPGEGVSSFQAEMSRELLYSGRPLRGEEYSGLFDLGIPEEREHLFRRTWAQVCRDDGADEVCLRIGSSRSGEAGAPRFLYAVTPEGKPVTYDVCGEEPADAVRTARDFLSSCGIRVSCAIVDSGCCGDDTVRSLEDQGVPYVIVIGDTPESRRRIAQKFGGRLKMNVDFLIPNTCLFGYQQPIRLFPDRDRQDSLTIFFDYQDRSEQVTALLQELYAEMSRLEACLRSGERPAIDRRYETLLTIRGDRTPRVEINSGQLQPLIDEKGLYGIVTSAEMTPEELHGLDASRRACEAQFRRVQIPPGTGIAGVRAGFAAGFLAGVIRREFETAAAECGRDANQMIRELEQTEAHRLNDIYACAHTESDSLREFFLALGADAGELLEESVRLENNRLAGRRTALRHRRDLVEKGIVTPEPDTRENPDFRNPDAPADTEAAPAVPEEPGRKKPGVKPGTKRGRYNKDGSVRKKPGPKPKRGSTPDPDAL